MPKNSFTDDTGDWSQILLSVGKRDGEVPFLKELLAELRLILATVTKLDTERLQLKARSQQISRDLDALRNRGRNVTGRIRSGLKTQYGTDSEQLTEFGVNPRRRKVRTRLAEQEALAKISDPDPVS
jgi:hypothetical protein